MAVVERALAPGGGLRALPLRNRLWRSSQPHRPGRRAPTVALAWRRFGSGGGPAAGAGGPSNGAGPKWVQEPANTLHSVDSADARAADAAKHKQPAWLQRTLGQASYLYCERRRALPPPPTPTSCTHAARLSPPARSQLAAGHVERPAALHGLQRSGFPGGRRHRKRSEQL